MNTKIIKPMIPKRVLGRTKLKVSVLAIGGGAFRKDSITSEKIGEIINSANKQVINFIDTAQDYGEAKIKNSIRGKNFVISTKITPFNYEDTIIKVEQSLNNLGVNKIDICMIQTLNSKQDIVNLKTKGVFKALIELRNQKKINFFGFSAHKIDIAIIALKTNFFDVAEIPYTVLIETKKYNEFFKISKRLNIGVIALRPFGGGIFVDRSKISKYRGTLNPKNLARFILAKKQISSVIVGMSSIEHLKENINAFSLKPFSIFQKRSFEKKVISIFDKHFCRGCLACMPCKNNDWSFDVPNFFVFYTLYKFYGLNAMKQEYAKLQKKANHYNDITCVCPYKINLETSLKQIHKTLSKK